MKVKQIKVVVLILMVLMGCSKGSLPPKEYTEWVRDNENGWHVTRQIGDVIIDVQNEPADYTILKESKGSLTGEVVMNQRRKELGNMDFYVLKVTNNQLDMVNDKSLGQMEINERLYYFSFGMQNDVYLQVGEKQFPVRIYNFERSYDLTKTKTFTLGFEKNKDLQDLDKTLVLDIKYTGIGKVKVSFLNEKLSKLPSLSI